jgi:hypothetical protein
MPTAPDPGCGNDHDVARFQSVSFGIEETAVAPEAWVELLLEAEPGLHP